MYGYTAGAADLTACIPPWAMAGGQVAMRRRLKEPDSRKRILDDIRTKTDWPNFYHNAGSPERILLVSFKRDVLKPLQGKTLAQIAKQREKDPVETLLDLLLEDESGIGTVYFITAEENIRKLIPLPWVSFGSDEAAQAPEGVFLKAMPHPRAYGNFARLLGKYVRDEKLLPLEKAIRKLTSLPATNMGLDHRGLLRANYFADVVVFDPKSIADRATYEKPHQYAVGVKQVFVNGVQVLKDGEHTGARPGRDSGVRAKRSDSASQGRPIVGDPFALDRPELLLAHAEALGDDDAQLRDRRPAILRLDQGLKDLLAARLGEGRFCLVLRHRGLLDWGLVIVVSDRRTALLLFLGVRKAPPDHRGTRPRAGPAATGWRRGDGRRRPLDTGNA